MKLFSSCVSSSHSECWLPDQQDHHHQNSPHQPGHPQHSHLYLHPGQSHRDHGVRGGDRDPGPGQVLGGLSHGGCSNLYHGRSVTLVKILQAQQSTDHSSARAGTKNTWSSHRVWQGKSCHHLSLPSWWCPPARLRSCTPALMPSIVRYLWLMM